MKASILIVSKNRKEDLRRTLLILEKCTGKDNNEILVFLDGSSDGSEELQEEFPQVRWQVSKKGIGASRARNLLYKKATGEILFGFDDDSHPLQQDFVEKTFSLFKSNENLGIIAFREIKGIYQYDEQIPKELLAEKKDYPTKDFMGCGFAIKKEVYDRTRGFPVWIDIYGEEACVALEVMELGYDLLYTYRISVNHRVDRDLRKRSGANYYRFEKQLKNTTYFYWVYYPFPLAWIKIGRLYFMNFKKYALKDKKYLKGWFTAMHLNFRELPSVFRYRDPVSKETLDRFNKLKNPNY
ncbi:glycosyltransferase family 2 protein [Salinimicrobium sp. CAU 1759]